MKAILRFQRKGPRCFLFLALSLPLGPTAQAQSTDELLTTLQKSSPPREGNSGDTRLSLAVEGLRKALALGRFADAEQYLTSMRTTWVGNDTAIAAIDQLQMAVRTQITAVEAKRDASLTAILEDASAKFIAHAPAADFDSLLKRLASLPVPQNQYNDPTAQKIESARSFLTNCQDYLLQSAAGNVEQTDNALDQIIQISSRLPVVPRSQMIALKFNSLTVPYVDLVSRTRSGTIGE